MPKDLANRPLNSQVNLSSTLLLQYMQSIPPNQQGSIIILLLSRVRKYVPRRPVEDEHIGTIVICINQRIES